MDGKSNKEIRILKQLDLEATGLAEPNRDNIYSRILGVTILSLAIIGSVSIVSLVVLGNGPDVVNFLAQSWNAFIANNGVTGIVVDHVSAPNIGDPWQTPPDAGNPNQILINPVIKWLCNFPTGLLCPR